jgi:two-component system NtrC family sensor kinase
LEALEQSGPFKLIVSDYRMPSMNGVEFLAEVCRRWPNTERMILSGYADTAAIVGAINEGQIYKFIAKPWNDVDLMHAIREAMDRYELRDKNRELLEELTSTNEELKAINDNLYRLVDDRVKEVLMQNRALLSFQSVLDALPIGFLGADDCGMVAVCNTRGSELLGLTSGELVGADLASTLPKEIVQLAVMTEPNSCSDCRCELPGGQCHVLITRLAGEQQATIMISIIKE